MNHTFVTVSFLTVWYYNSKYEKYEKYDKPVVFSHVRIIKRFSDIGCCSLVAIIIAISVSLV